MEPLHQFSSTMENETRKDMDSILFSNSTSASASASASACVLDRYFRSLLKIKKCKAIEK